MTARRIWLMLAYSTTLLVAVMAVNAFVDPYGAWRRPSTDSGAALVHAGTERVRAAYRLRTATPQLVLLGTSRVLGGIPIEEGYRHGVLSGALPGSTLDESIAVMRHVSRERLERVVWELELFAFGNFTGLRDSLMQARLDRSFDLAVSETLISSATLDDSIRVLQAWWRGLPPKLQRSIPWPSDVIRQSFDEPVEVRNNDQATFQQLVRDWFDVNARFELSEERLTRIHETLADLTASGLDVVVVLPPLSEYELEAIRQSQRWDTFLEWKRRLAAITPFWDFSGYNAVARCDNCFSYPDFIHMRPGVGNAMLHRVLGDPCDDCGEKGRAVAAAGVYVTAATIEAHLEAQQAALADRLREHSQYAAVTQALRQAQH